MEAHRFSLQIIVHKDTAISMVITIITAMDPDVSEYGELLYLLRADIENNDNLLKISQMMGIP